MVLMIELGKYNIKFGNQLLDNIWMVENDINSSRSNVNKLSVAVIIEEIEFS